MGFGPATIARFAQRTFSVLPVPIGAQGLTAHHALDMGFAATEFTELGYALASPIKARVFGTDCIANDVLLALEEPIVTFHVLVSTAYAIANLFAGASRVGLVPIALIALPATLVPHVHRVSTRLEGSAPETDSVLMGEMEMAVAIASLPTKVPNAHTSRPRASLLEHVCNALAQLHRASATTKGGAKAMGPANALTVLGSAIALGHVLA